MTLGIDQAAELHHLLKNVDAEKVVFKAEKDNDDDFELTADTKVIKKYLEEIQRQLHREENVGKLRGNYASLYTCKKKHILFEDPGEDGTRTLTISSRNDFRISRVMIFWFSMVMKFVFLML